MLVIATDEAGYGPTLGPMVVAGSAWVLQGNPDAVPDQAFQAYGQPVSLGKYRLFVADSKAVFKSGGSLFPLRVLAAYTAKICGWNVDGVDDFLQNSHGLDWLDRKNSPWLLPQNQTSSEWPSTEIGPLEKAWHTADARLVDCKTTVLTASRFNQIIDRGLNKSDLLGETTLKLVQRLMADQNDPGDIQIFCDRHGGRRYYAGVLQHFFPSRPPQVITESALLSRYRIETDKGPATISFTVKGDRFAPVAYSSMIAKWTREELMIRLNHFFQSHSNNLSLEPTAGYPVDADRFLKQTESIRRELGIADKHLIRCR
jgi:hypothetical protein